MNTQKEGIRMIVYRLKLEVGYRDVILEFDNAKDAGEFASTLLLHATNKSNYICKVSMQVVDTEKETAGENEHD